MPTFEDIARPGECDVCGKKTDVVVVCSAMGPVSLAYCNDCYNRNLEPYSLMVMIRFSQTVIGRCNKAQR